MNLYTLGVVESDILQKVGEPIGSYFGYKVEKVFMSQSEIDSANYVDTTGTPQPGYFKFQDVNNDGKVDADDRTAIGNYIPDFYYGITNEFDYGNWNLSFFRVFREVKF